MFESLWPSLDERLKGVGSRPEGVVPDRTEKEILNEVLDLIRGISRPH